MAQVENNFLIALNGVKLSDAQKQKINSGIQEIVMRELAQIDHTETVIKKGNPEALLSFKDRPFIWGIVADFKNSIINIQNIAQR